LGSFSVSLSIHFVRQIHLNFRADWYSFLKRLSGEGGG
jgi:hypothetical protein